MTWIVTGGAGYIGSEVAHHLLATGLDVLVIDDLSTGFASAVPAGANFLELDLRDPTLRTRLPSGMRFEGIVHAAGVKYAGESVKYPFEHYSRNLIATLSLMTLCRDLNIPRLILSSSASVYGTPKKSPVSEDALLEPESPYGRSKLAAEWVTRDFALALGIEYTCLRFFNVVGVGLARVPDRSPFNLFPNIVRALETDSQFQLFGANLATNDGTCLRDYIHVTDIAAGHLSVIAAWDRGRSLAHAYNLGLGEGISVRQVLNEFEEVSGRAIDVEVRPHRPGDPAAVWASIDLARKELNWIPKAQLSEMVTSSLF